jgi:hypothetical protein
MIAVLAEAGFATAAGTYSSASAMQSATEPRGSRPERQR